MQAILNKENFDTSDSSGSVRNIYNRYRDIIRLVSEEEELQGKALVYFVYWLLDNVVLVEIKTSNHDMALEIF